MTIRISQHKASKIIHYFFKGLPQPEIADKCGINQATVSRYALKFKIDANEVGIIAAAKEYRVMHEVDALRSLAVELFNNKLTAEDAKEGVTILKYFNGLGILPNEHKTLVKVISKLKNPDFVPSAMKLIKLESAMGKTYIEAVSHYECLSTETPQLEQKNTSLKQEREDIQQAIKKLTNERTRKQQSLRKLEKAAKRRQSVLKARIDKSITDTGLTWDRIKRLEPVVDTLKKMGISGDKLEVYLKKHQELEEVGVTMDSLKTMIKAMKK